jgi:hypothetical protein
MTRIIVFILLLSANSFGQVIKLETPARVTAKVGHFLAVRINVSEIKNYTLSMQGNPPSAKLDKSNFILTPSHAEIGTYFVRIILKDSIGNQRGESDLDLTVEAESTAPIITFNQIMPDTINAIEGQPYSFSAGIKSTRGADPKALLVYFLFNENADQRSFDSCRITRMGDQILFNWIPSNREATKGFQKFRITVVDVDNSILSRVLNFKIKNINMPPRFKYNIPDTVFIRDNEGLSLDFTATDPDNDKLDYHFTPKTPFYHLEGTRIVIKKDVLSADPSAFPVTLTVTVSDGEHSIKRSVHLLSGGSKIPLIGDFTRKEFVEGDSLITYLNVSGNANLKDYSIKLSDLSLPQGVGNLSDRLVLKKESSYLKVISRGVLPYYLVDRDYTYNIAVTVSGSSKGSKSEFKILELKIYDRPDPTDIGHQKDSLLHSVERFLKIENQYGATLEKMSRQINRPWWKKAAVVTGTLSGVLSLIQSQNQNKSISTFSAVISLASITVSNLPSLTEKTLSRLTDKISSSKGRTEQIQEKESELKAIWLLQNNREGFEKIKAEVTERLRKGSVKRGDEICELMVDKKIKRRVARLIKAKDTSETVKAIFSACVK